MSSGPGLAVVAPGSSRAFGARVAAEFGLALGELEEREFEDGEGATRPRESVRGRDVYVLRALDAEPGASANDKLVRLLLLLGALRDAGAARLTAVVPYLCYARQERRVRPGDAVATRYVAALLETAGADRVVAFEVHDRAAFDNAFRCRSEHLAAGPLFVEHYRRELAGRAVVVVSPDAGGYKRAERFRRALAAALGAPVGMAFLEKSRTGTELLGGAVVGEVEGRVAVIYDDLIATGAPLARAVRACAAHGAAAVHAAAAHGLFAGGAPELFAEKKLERVAVTNSVTPWRLRPVDSKRVDVVDAVPRFAGAIERLHAERPLDDLAGD